MMMSNGNHPKHQKIVVVATMCSEMSPKMNSRLPNVVDGRSGQSPPDSLMYTWRDMLGRLGRNRCPRGWKPVFAAGSQGKPHVHEFLRTNENAPSAPKNRSGVSPMRGKMIHGLLLRKEIRQPQRLPMPKDRPPQMYQPPWSTHIAFHRWHMILDQKSAGEDTILLPMMSGDTQHCLMEYDMRDSKGSNKNLADRIGTIKLLAQSGFFFKPMVEEAIVPVSHKSTYSCYLRKVTSYIISWSGCVTMKTLRGYKRRSDEDWIRLYNYCMARSHLRQTHLYLETKEMAALCGVLGDTEVVNSMIRPITSKQFPQSCSHFYRRQC